MYAKRRYLCILCVVCVVGVCAIGALLARFIWLSTNKWYERVVQPGLSDFQSKKKEEENKKAEKLVKLIVYQTLATFSMLKLFTQDV